MGNENTKEWGLLFLNSNCITRIFRIIKLYTFAFVWWKQKVTFCFIISILVCYFWEERKKQIGLLLLLLLKNLLKTH